MKFGSVPVMAAEGGLSAHSVQHAEGKIKKGQLLLRADIEALVHSGVEEIVVAWLEAGDVHEDKAAAQIAEALVSNSIRADPAFTGRVNLFAESAGVLLVDEDAVARLNAIDEAVTLATLEPFARVTPGKMVATVKIIPYAAPKAAVEQAVALIKEAGSPMSLAPFAPHRAGLVSTKVHGTRDKVLDKTARIIGERLERLGATLEDEIRCAHDAEAIAGAISRMKKDRLDPIIVFGASAIVDRRDMVPAGIKKAGGSIDHFGMPVDPGNLLLLGSLDGATVIGAPGCARSPKENGFDWVLQRVLAGLEISREDFTKMGAGGLLMEIESRPHPRVRKKDAAAKPSIAVVVLAAGRSRRMGGPNKLLEQLGGKPLVRHAAEAALASAAQRVVVVTGHMEDQVRAALEGLDVDFAHNPDFAEGLSTSVKAGLGALGGGADAAVIMLGDMPRISADLIDALIAAYAPGEGRNIIVPTFEGKRGNPVLFSADYFEELGAIRGDVGARHLIGKHGEAVHEVAADEAVVLDVDTPDALARARDAFEQD